MLHIKVYFYFIHFAIFWFGKITTAFYYLVILSSSNFCKIFKKILPLESKNKSKVSENLFQIFLN